ncbi:ataxin-10 isoform X1 [Electrophorus electricus]|nr:ataxin-10 isoform X1 [Electrophorus electricus]XP_035384001.1 ataxin-10 isoform X1 [Electrophorus electricus]XP_035384002.1 ataxin-10 isoform X1 [Electrophorus electricus]
MFSQISLLDEMCMGKFTVEHLTTLQTVTKALRDEQFRFNVERGVLERLFAVLVRLYDEFRGLDEGRSVSLRLQLTAECFRAHRNACVQCSHNQCLLRDQGCIQVSLGILGTLLKITTGDPDNLFDAIRCGIQFLGNIAVGNHLCKADIWGHAFPHMFLDLLELCDEKATAYACMVLHTCLDEDKTEQLWTEPQHLKVALKIMELCRTEPDIDWPFLIATQHFFRSSELTKRIYAEMNDQERLTLLELILAQLGEGKEEDCLIPPRTAQILASYFQNSCKSVLSLSSASSANDQKALAVVRLLDILCEMTSKTNFRTLQDHPDLLQSTVELLKEVHLLGKASKNVFSAAQDFSLTEPGGAASHPAVSFKAHLIRLIGNLCHGHMANKDQIRELDGIALILDCCSIDSNNPFISQWAVFAIRNILEHNLENQKLVQGLKRQGVADDSMLREMGFRVEQRDGSLLLRPLKKEEWHGDN